MTTGQSPLVDFRIHMELSHWSSIMSAGIIQAVTVANALPLTSTAGIWILVCRLKWSIHISPSVKYISFHLGYLLGVRDFARHLMTRPTVQLDLNSPGNHRTPRPLLPFSWRQSQCLQGRYASAALHVCPEYALSNSGTLITHFRLWSIPRCGLSRTCMALSD